MSVASQANAYRPIGVLLGGPFAPQRALEAKPVVCALLRSRAHLADAADQTHSTGSASVATQPAVGRHA